MNSEIVVTDFAVPAKRRSLTLRLGALLDSLVFVALLFLTILAAVLYGGSDPWLKLFLACLIFAVGALAALELVASERNEFPGLKLLLPIIVLIAFSLVQTIPSPQANGIGVGIPYRFWRAISADPYETRIFAIELAALTLFALLLFRYTRSERRLGVLVNVIIVIVLASALFGLLRQTMQHKTGFLLPLLEVDQGYGQFINKNHFAYLMEMGFGLLLGFIAAGGVGRERALVYLAALLPVWTALVLANSRGGILAMLVQVVATLLLVPLVARSQPAESGKAWRLIQSRPARIVLVLSLILLVVIGVSWVGGDRLATSIEAARGEFTESAEAKEGVTRTRIWRDTVSLIEANPIAGVGLGGYWAAIPTYHRAPGSMTPQQAHNDYLELLASGGILGSAIAIWFIVVLVKQARARLASLDQFPRAACFGALVGIAGVAVHSLVDFGLHRMVNAMIFTALIVIATCNVNKEGKRLRKDA